MRRCRARMLVLTFLKDEIGTEIAQLITNNSDNLRIIATDALAVTSMKNLLKLTITSGDQLCAYHNEPSNVPPPTVPPLVVDRIITLCDLRDLSDA